MTKAERLVFVVFAAFFAATSANAATDIAPKGVAFLESKVRPLLIDRYYE